jgi:predicted  nucleic acid-binding Zn-ribbon protein
MGYRSELEGMRARQQSLEMELEAAADDRSELEKELHEARVQRATQWAATQPRVLPASGSAEERAQLERRIQSLERELQQTRHWFEVAATREPASAKRDWNGFWVGLCCGLAMGVFLMLLASIG